MFRVAILCSASLILAGCFSNHPRGDGSLLMITIPHFRADDLDCRALSESQTPHLSEICAESIRFTHAYTTSLIENSALGSALTGLYPVEHGVRSNAASKYEEGVVSVGHVARSQGLVTIFVSGGAPGLRKSAISDGFDDFDDSVRVQGSFYRPAVATAERLLSLVESRADNLSFFAVVEFVDLLFPTLSIKPDVPGVLKENVTYGKLQDIDDGVGKIRARFKKLGIWDAMTVVVVGLQGVDNVDRDGQKAGPYLYDDAVRVPLLIKPSRKPKDLAPGWKVDTPVSLADLGETLIDILGGKTQKSRLTSAFQVMSLAPVLNGERLPDTLRPLFSENTLPLWRGWGSRLLAQRYGEWLYWPGAEKKLFNTYTDRYQLHDLAGKDPATLLRMDLVWDKYKDRMEPNLRQVSSPLPVSVSEKMRIAQSLFESSLSPEEKLRDLMDLRVRRPKDWQVMQWLVNHLITMQNWPELHSLLKTAKPDNDKEARELAVWSYYLRMRSGAKASFGKQKDNHYLDCLSFAESLKRFNTREYDWIARESICPDAETDLWLKSYFYHKMGQSNQSQAFFETAKSATEHRLEQTEFAKLFWIAGACFDFDERLPNGPAFFDLFVSLSSNEDFRNFVKRR